jgi:hypothetical protein
MEVFDFTPKQLWGPSEERNKEDSRYLRVKKGANGWADVRPLVEYSKANGTPYIPEEKYPQYAGLDHELTWYGSPENFGYLPSPPRDEYLTPRLALQQLGTEWGRNCYPDIWVEKTIRIAQNLLQAERMHPKLVTLRARYPMIYTARDGAYQWDDVVQHLWVPSGSEPWGNTWYSRHEHVVIPDVRFVNEINAIRKAGGKVIRIRRPDIGQVYNHQSESEQAGIEDDVFDKVIDNDGTLEDLATKVRELESILKG